MRISRIQFKNYRAFIGTSDAIEVDCKNLLIYGENGSGKSSVYLGLKDFFKAFDVTWTFEKSPKHLKAPPDDDFEVSLSFGDGAGKTLIYNGQPLEDDEIGQTFLLNSFLSYKELLKTHLIESDLLGERMFELLTETLLRDNELGDSTVGRTLEDIHRLLDARKADDKERRDELITTFNALFPDILTRIGVYCQQILNYFGQGLTIELAASGISIEQTKDERGRVKRTLKGEVGLSVTYLENSNLDYREVLNEARLSALALSIYLAAIVANPGVQNAVCKVIVLDDVFIGLDMSNRLPLLKVLKSFSLENGPFFEDFQKIITTYDRYWFEIAKKSLGSSWIAIEMFVGEQLGAAGVKTCDKPVIIQEDLGNLDKAERFFQAFDYYSAANWLRKALEEELERLIPEVYRINVDRLDGLIDKLFLYYGECLCNDLIPSELKVQLKTFKDSILNPSSHYDLQSPIYRAEIENAFEVLHELRNLEALERTLLIGMRSPIFYRNEVHAYQAEYIVRENIYKVAAGDEVRITDAQTSLIGWSFQGTQFAKPNHTIYTQEEVAEMKGRLVKLSARSVRIQQFLNLPESPDWLTFTDVEGNTLFRLGQDR